MLFMYVRAAVQIGNRAGDLEDAVVGAGREPQAVGDQLQHAVAGSVKFAVFLDEARRHLGVTVDFGAFVSFQLYLSRTCHSLGDLR